MAIDFCNPLWSSIRTLKQYDELFYQVLDVEDIRVKLTPLETLLNGLKFVQYI